MSSYNTAKFRDLITRQTLLHAQLDSLNDQVREARNGVSRLEAYAYSTQAPKTVTKDGWMGPMVAEVKPKQKSPDAQAAEDHTLKHQKGVLERVENQHSGVRAEWESLSRLIARCREFLRQHGLSDDPDAPVGMVTGMAGDNHQLVTS